MAANPDVPEGAPLLTMNSMYELRHYDGFGHIGHPTSDFRMSEDTARILKHGYYASVSYVDALLGDLFTHMKQLGIYENTIIIVWGDHGWKLGDHNSWGKMTNYNIDLQVPLMIRYPKQTKRGAQTFALTELVDMFPTICELANVPIPDYMEGKSLVPLLQNPEIPWKKAAFSQFHRRPKVSADGKRYMGYSMNTVDYHYIEWYDWQPKKSIKGDFVTAELYHRKKDPHETINIAQDAVNSEVVQQLSAQLAASWEAAMKFE